MLLCAFPLTAFAEEIVTSGPEKIVGSEKDEATYYYESENNNSRGKADLLTRDCIYVIGSVGRSGDSYDYYKIRTDRSYYLELQALSGSSRNSTKFQICNSSGKVLKTASYQGKVNNGGDTYYKTSVTLAPGTYYIRVSDKSYWVEYEFYFDVMPALNAPKPSSTTNKDTGKPVIKWSAVSGADYYRVYRATSKSGTYKLVKSTSSTSYTDTSAKVGKKYYYKVKAMSQGSDYKDSLLSAGTSEVCDCARPDVWLTYKSNGKTIVNWDSVSGAKNYKVYCSTSKSGTYKCIGTTSKTRLLHSDGKSGKVYYYKVKAISRATTSANSAYSVIQSQRVK